MKSVGVSISNIKNQIQNHIDDCNRLKSGFYIGLFGFGDPTGDFDIEFFGIGGFTEKQFSDGEKWASKQAKEVHFRVG